MSKKIKIKFPDGSEKEFEKGITSLDIAKSISEGLARAVLAAKFNDLVIDLTRPLEEDGSLELLKFDAPEGKDVFYHTAAHVFAQALERVLGDDVKIAIGPPIENGFHYDFRVKEFHQEDLEKIEKEMKKIVDAKIPIQRLELDKKGALSKYKDNPFKVEMIKGLDGEITCYEQGEFSDLCRGPHLPHTGYVKAFKLTKIAGAYWKGNAENEQLQRVYGVAFPDKKLLKEYLTRLEEAEKRDHRKLGKAMGLFSFHEEGPGFPFFHNKGTFIFNKLTEFMTQEMLKRDYELNRTPIILNKSLWLQSGHWDHYKDNMYFTKIDKKDYAVKPMNCPGNLLVYKNDIHSYRELPIRAGEFGLVHRHEMSGVLAGLFRVRAFTQDDAHVFCMEEQLEEEIMELINFIDFVYSTFGFEYHMELSTRPEKAMGDPKLWDKAENILETVLKSSKREFKINPGDGAFYGPKIDYHLKDAIGRTWQCGTIQLDFSMPEKFDLTYEGKDGKKHRPVMLHRAIYGSIERFLGILIEHYAGKFPLWLSPVQVKIIGIADRHEEYAQKILSEFKQEGIRAEIDCRAETVNYKVREAQMQKINYILVVGDQEEKNSSVNLRNRDGEVEGEIKLKDLIIRIQKEVEEKK